MIVKEPISDYEARRADKLTSHGLRDFMQGPADFNEKSSEPKKPKAHNAEGAAIHCCTLEGPMVYRERYEIGGPVNPRTGKAFGLTSQKFLGWATVREKELADAGTPRTCITPECGELVRRLFDAVWQNPKAFDLLHGSTPEVSVLATYGGIDAQSRLDAWKPRELILDLKTVDELGRFAMQVEMFGYRHQMAFYRSMVAKVTGDSLPCHLIAVEKREPYRIEVRELTDRELAEAERENDAGIRALARCRASGKWPSTFNVQEELWK